MELVKLGKKGQISIPRAVLKSLGIEKEAPMLIDTTPEGAIILRQAVVYPLEIYSEERVALFLKEDTLSATQKEKIGKIRKDRG